MDSQDTLWKSLGCSYFFFITLFLSPLLPPERFKLVGSCALTPMFFEGGHLHGPLENSPSLRELSAPAFFDWCEARFSSWMMVSSVIEEFSLAVLGWWL